ncbi:RAB6A-GEF complex partner protein 2 [Nymphon striatum]|nr:RAB6A-GEF complex partner protein 2 [Nymphon striatum]
MIEINANIPRGPVFLAGETIECHITFCNPAMDPNNPSHSNSDVCETLAWASAQIHCQCSVDDNKVQIEQIPIHIQEEAAISNEETSFAPCRGEIGHVAIATQPKILFCDLRLLSGEKKSFIYKEVIPTEAPPTYRGFSVKYSYKITIGTQRVNSAIKLLRVPIRILVLQGLMEILRNSDNEQQVSPSNPFFQEQEKESPLDMALQMLQNLTARKCPSFYNVTNNRGKVVRFCLFKNSFKLGEDIVGTFDFSQATVPCVQFSATLESEEKINEERQLQKQGYSKIRSYSKCHEYCLHMKKTHMVLPIPLNVCPAFSTDIASLSWKLHFEFVTTTTELDDRTPPKSEKNNTTWTGPQNLDIETMVWDLPIAIVPCNPVQVYFGLQLKNSIDINI